MAKKRIMVCVTQQKACEKLLVRANSLKGSETDEVHIVHVIKDNWKYFGNLKESDALEFLFDISSKFGTDMHVFKAMDIVDKLSEFAKDNKIDVIVMGQSKEVKKDQNMIYRLRNNINRDIEFNIVELDDI
ncbi:MAG: universal stress protein UspA [Clostridiales bacterium]|nr:MAG: universal stress protein UspA [Clostridiales bacterium]